MSQIIFLLPSHGDPSDDAAVANSDENSSGFVGIEERDKMLAEDVRGWQVEDEDVIEIGRLGIEKLGVGHCPTHYRSLITAFTSYQLSLVHLLAYRSYQLSIKAN